MFEGSIDQVTTTKATGWLYDRTAGRTADVLATLHGRIIGSAPSSLHRPDLEDVGFGDGVCGFDLPFDEPMRDCDLPFVTVQPRGSNLSIPRTNMDSYKDLVAQTMRLYPGAGRSRTVLGSLWTDCTDALQILAGRVKVGTCDSAIFQALRTLIADGLVQLPIEGDGFLDDVADKFADSRFQGAELTEATIALGAHVFSARTAVLLKTVFDDIPIVYRPGVVIGEQAHFAQAGSLEPLTSPAEMLLGYVLVHGEEGRLDYVFDSHDLPEFTSGGVSRWAPGSETVVPVIAAGSQRPIRTVELSKSMLTLVGPGLIHRVVRQHDAGIVRIIATPQRVTPLRFLDDGAKWADVALANGVRGRL